MPSVVQEEVTNTLMQAKRNLFRHKGEVNSIAISGDYKYIAACSDDGTISVHDANKREVTDRLTSHKGMVLAVDIDKDATMLVSGCADGQVKLWKLSEGKHVGEECTVHLHSDEVFALKFSHDAKSFASGCNDSKVIICEIKNEADKLSFSQKSSSPFTEHNSYVNCIAWASGNTLIASGDSSGTILVWRVENNQVLFTFEDHFDALSSVAFHSKNKFLISASADGSLIMWDLRGWDREEQTKSRQNSHNRILAHLDENSEEVFCMALSSNNAYVASGNGDRTIRLWDTTSKRQIKVFKRAHTGRVRSLAWSTDCQTIVSGGEDGTIFTWNIDLKVCPYFSSPKG